MSEGYTPLIISSAYGDKEIVKLLLENSADVNAKTDDGINALIEASKNGFIGTFS